MNMTKHNDQSKRAARKTAWMVGFMAVAVYVVFIVTTVFGAGA